MARDHAFARHPRSRGSPVNRYVAPIRNPEEFACFRRYDLGRRTSLSASDFTVARIGMSRTIARRGVFFIRSGRPKRVELSLMSASTLAARPPPARAAKRLRCTSTASDRAGSRNDLSCRPGRLLSCASKYNHPTSTELGCLPAVP